MAGREERDSQAVGRDLALGYISAETARTIYGMDPAAIEDVLSRARKAEVF